MILHLTSDWAALAAFALVLAYVQRSNIRRALRAAKSLSRDKRLPKWLRVLFVIGCVQIPVLPTDEVAMAIALTVLWFRHRAILLEAWLTAEVTA